MATQRWTLSELLIDREGKPVPSGGGVGGYSYVLRSTCNAANEPEARAVFQKRHPQLFDPAYKGDIPRAWIALSGSLRRYRLPRPDRAGGAGDETSRTRPSL